jgi:aspartate ammonia-lyase
LALHDQFVVDVIQGGAGTSTNMNANEVIANRALEQLGHAKGEYRTCTRTTTSTPRRAPTTSTPPRCAWPPVFGIDQTCSPRWPTLRGAFEAKAAEFADVLKIGRTQLQDAVPMTLGQEFLAYAVMIARTSSACARRAR